MRPIKNILVTGANGFVGRSLLTELIEKKEYNLTALDKSDSCIPRHYKSLGRFSFIKSDISRKDSLVRIPANTDILIHLASAIPHHGKVSEEDMIHTNVTGTFNLFSFVQRHCEIENIIFSSSVSVYPAQDGYLKESTAPDPLDTYGITKLAGELFVKTVFKKERHFILRYPSIYGIGQNPSTVMPIFIHRAVTGNDIVIYGAGNRRQNFIHANDVARSILACLVSVNPGVYNIGSTSSTSMKELAGTIISVFSSRSRIRYVKKEEDRSVEFDVSLAKKNLGFKCRYSLKQGLEEMRKRMSGS